MAKSSSAGSGDSGIRLVFSELATGETAPDVALYALDEQGRAKEKLAQARDGVLPIPANRLKGRIALGPVTDDAASLTADELISYRADQVASIWAKQGLVLPRDRWIIFWPLFRCVHGHVRKCRPWWLDIIAVRPSIAVAGLKRSRTIALETQTASIATLASSVSSILYPLRCVPLCDGVVEVIERQCCCHHIPIWDLIERLREILERIPIPWPPDPEPGPWPEPQPGPDPTPIEASGGLRQRVLQPIQLAKASGGAVARSFDAAMAPPKRLYQAYQDLQRLPAAEAARYVIDRPWLYPFFCHCTSRKVGEVAIQPGGLFSYCYRGGPPPYPCHLTYAYRIRQLIGGAWVTVYDGVASGAWFSAGEDANIRVTNPRALPCGDQSGDPPPNEGTPFVMLEHVTGAGTHHFNFPTQTGVSMLAAPDVNDGLYDTGYAPDAPWGAGLGLRLWVSPELQGTVAFYRLSVVPLNMAGVPTGAPQVLDAAVSWSRFVFIGGNWVTQADSLGPVTQGAESHLFRVPYWLGGMNWLSGQYHQIWNTNAFADGRYMLVIELFDGAGARIKPNGSTGPGAAKAFQFRRWSSDTVTLNVPFADCAHMFWIDNIPVSGDIVDLRKNGVPNTGECQFIKGSPTAQFSIGYRAFHVNGVSNNDSFMYSHSISWQRGLNGPTGTLAPAVSATTDAGEGGPPAQSGSATFGSMLGTHGRCTFSVHLAVYAKHTNGASRLSAYDYYETASFALDQT